MNARENRAIAIGMIAVVLADWLSKYWITTRLAVGESMALIDGWFYLAHRKNPGVAFSTFADLPELWRTPLLSLLSIVGIILFTRILATTPDRIVRAAAALVLAGAVANLGDRLVSGHVTDFLLVRYFPFVFNVADAAISVGGVVMVVRVLLTDAEVIPSRATPTADAS